MVTAPLVPHLITCPRRCGEALGGGAGGSTLGVTVAMRRILRAVLIAAALTAAGVAARIHAALRSMNIDTEEDLWPDPRVREGFRLEGLRNALQGYAGGHPGTLPADLRTLLAWIPSEERAAVAGWTVDLWGTAVAYTPIGSAFLRCGRPVQTGCGAPPTTSFFQGPLPRCDRQALPAWEHRRRPARRQPNVR